ncbi:MAG: hypothetical protein QXQ23_01775 [Sulfolobales archaeon]
MGSHIPEPRSTRGRGNAPETGRGAEPGESRECSSKPPQNPRTLGRGGGQIDIHTHPTRKAVELISTRLSKDFRKAGYAEHQLIESSRTEGEVLREWCEKLFKKSTA